MTLDEIFDAWDVNDDPGNPIQTCLRLRNPDTGEPNCVIAISVQPLPTMRIPPNCVRVDLTAEIEFHGMSDCLGHDHIAIVCAQDSTPEQRAEGMGVAVCKRGEPKVKKYFIGDTRTKIVEAPETVGAMRLDDKWGAQCDICGRAFVQTNDVPCCPPCRQGDLIATVRTLDGGVVRKVAVSLDENKKFYCANPLDRDIPGVHEMLAKLQGLHGTGGNFDAN